MDWSDVPGVRISSVLIFDEEDLNDEDDSCNALGGGSVKSGGSSTSSSYPPISKGDAVEAIVPSSPLPYPNVKASYGQCGMVRSAR